MGPVPRSSVAPPAPPSVRVRLTRFYRWLAPIRLLFFLLIALAVVGAILLGPAAVLAQLLLVPLAAGATDLLLELLRKRRLRFPWAGAVTGLFVALLLPPQGVSANLGGATILYLAAAMAVVGVLAKQVFRSRGYPWFNPAALAVVTAGVLFGITPAWWAAISLPAVLVAGLILNARQWTRWRVPVVFLLTYTALSAVESFLQLGGTNPAVLLLGVLDPSVLFFTLFMATEPRTSPSDPTWQPVYAAAMGLSAALLRIAFHGGNLLLSSDNLLLGLLAANFVWVLLRPYASRSVAPVPAPSRRARPPAARSGARQGFGWAERSGIAFAVFVLLAVSYGVIGGPPAPPSAVPPKVVVVSCTQDNRTISSADLSMLHQRLGPSVVFSYSAASGTAVFYDPVNKVTVYETDLFEDYGYAEFNGDDQVIANGCSLGSA
jgi:Na+-translocating ferredoxin:NAD+ oxidoreductase RnfD subunit